MFEKILRKKIDNIDDWYLNFLVDITELSILENRISDATKSQGDFYRNRISAVINLILDEYEQVELLMDTDDFKDIVLSEDEQSTLRNVKPSVLEYLADKNNWKNKIQ
jgi:hypothetical protein